MGHNSSKPASPKPTTPEKTEEVHEPVSAHPETPITQDGLKPETSVEQIAPEKPEVSTKQDTSKPATSTKQASPLTNFNPKYDVIKKLNLPQYGEVTLVKEHDTDKEMLLKKVVATSKEGYEAELRICEQRASFKNNNVVQVLGYNHEQKKTFCSSFYNIDAFVEHYEKTLFDGIQEAIVHQTPFAEGEALFLIESLVSCLAYFQINGVTHGDIRPSNIFVVPGGYKLSDPTLGPHKNYSGYHFALFEGCKTLIAPEYLKQLAEKQPAVFITSKSDVFSVGAVLLSAATLTNSEDLYDYEGCSFNEVLLNQRLEQVRARYSQFTYELIRDMLTIDEERRPTFVALEARIRPYRELIISRTPLFATKVVEEDDLLRKADEQIARSQQLRSSFETRAYHNIDNGKVMF